MSTKQRLSFVLLLASPLAFGQAKRSLAAAPTVVEPPTSQPQVLLASNGAAPEALVPPASQRKSLLRPALLTRSARTPEVWLSPREPCYPLTPTEHVAAVHCAWTTRRVRQQGGRQRDRLGRPCARSGTLYP